MEMVLVLTHLTGSEELDRQRAEEYWKRMKPCLLWWKSPKPCGPLSARMSL